jgi:hypothetical protein
LKQQQKVREQVALVKSSHLIGRLRQQVWSCQATLDVPRAKASQSIWALGPSLRYRGWVARQWRSRAADCAKAVDRRTIPTTNDWQTAVRLVQRAYPGTADWLLYISHREGGHGGFVMNHQGSGAGGWMQFMASTFYAHNDSAYADLRRRGFIVSSSTNSWTHPLGQAITAGYMRFTGQDGCHWCL